MKFIHSSDTHLGYSDYHKIDPNTGINQREQDFYNSWNFLIEEILRQKPDFVIHAGDLFHTTRPTNRAIAVALEGIQQVSDAAIPFIMISGNHSTPKIRATGSIFESILLFPNVYAAFQSKYQKFKIGDIAIHCIPHCSLTEELQAAFKKIKPDKKAEYQILVTHGSWAGQKSFSMGEFNEQKLPDPQLISKIEFDYIALGHYHKHIKIKPNVVYSGSTERTSFNEADNPTGYVLVQLDEFNVDYNELPSRPMFRLDPIDCQELNTSQIYSELAKRSTDQLRDALVSLTLANIQHDTLVKLDSREIDQVFRQVFYLNKSITQLVSQGGGLSKSTDLGTVPMEFERYIDAIKEGELDKKRLKNLGLDYLMREM
ncbi:MAG: exonuclease SbcCD subunit D [bacterium]|nr:MAG: exonuclease SbcCD subunit D [bacterium]